MRRNHGPLLALAAVALAGCASSSQPSAAALPNYTASSSQSAAARRPVRRPKPVPPRVVTVTETTPVVQTVTTTRTQSVRVANPKTPTNVPVACLQSAGLTDIRLGVEPGATVGNVPGSVTSDVNQMVFVNGPYKSGAIATASAKAILASQYSAAGGVWVASATRTSRLSSRVSQVAGCLAGAPR